MRQSQRVERAFKALSETCAELISAKRGKWFGESREAIDAHEETVCDHLKTLRDHIDSLESRIAELEATIAGDDDGDELVFDESTIDAAERLAMRANMDVEDLAELDDEALTSLSKRHNVPVEAVIAAVSTLRQRDAGAGSNGLMGDLIEKIQALSTKSHSVTVDDEYEDGTRVKVTVKSLVDDLESIEDESERIHSEIRSMMAVAGYEFIDSDGLEGEGIWTFWERAKTPAESGETCAPCAAARRAAEQAAAERS